MFNAEKEHIEFGVEPDLRVNMLQDDKDRMKDTIIEMARKMIKERS